MSREQHQLIAAVVSLFVLIAVGVIVAAMVERGERTNRCAQLGLIYVPNIDACVAGFRPWEDA